jgi:D-beta-D-heptose 7-phosphate kinase/D-beta-D-heptose 1-phosphate adenosyltransferase
MMDKHLHRSASKLATLVAKEHGQNHRLVFTNGVFDMLHPGHIDLLCRAKALGDLLIVGVNSDTSTRRLKGMGRPIIGECERASMLAALSCVDHVIIFEETTAEHLVLHLRPETYVKGDDYEAEQLPEACAVRAVGGRVVILPRLHRISTTTLIERILSLNQ